MSSRDPLVLPLAATEMQTSAPLEPAGTPPGWHQTANCDGQGYGTIEVRGSASTCDAERAFMQGKFVAEGYKHHVRSIGATAYDTTFFTVHAITCTMCALILAAGLAAHFVVVDAIDTTGVRHALAMAKTQNYRVLMRMATFSTWPLVYISLFAHSLKRDQAMSTIRAYSPAERLSRYLHISATDRCLMLLVGAVHLVFGYSTGFRDALGDLDLNALLLVSFYGTYITLVALCKYQVTRITWYAPFVKAKKPLYLFYTAQMKHYLRSMAMNVTLMMWVCDRYLAVVPILPRAAGCIVSTSAIGSHDVLSECSGDTFTPNHIDTNASFTSWAGREICEENVSALMINQFIMNAVSFIRSLQGEATTWVQVLYEKHDFGGFLSGQPTIILLFL